MKSLFCVFLLAVGSGVAAGLTREYIFNKTSLTWEKAQSSCRQYYKDLATITTIEENNRILQCGSGYGNSWIGLKLTSDIWGWSDGEPVSLLKWPGISPPYSISWASCGATYFYQRGFWMNYYCNYTSNFYCYRYLILVQEEMTWDEAQEYCRTYYTGLASVTSETSLQQLNLETAQTQTESVWIGLSFLNRIWLWVSGEQLGSLVSMPPMPSCPALSYRCGILDTKTNSIRNQNCNERLNFVCYWQ